MSFVQFALLNLLHQVNLLSTIRQGVILKMKTMNLRLLQMKESEVKLVDQTFCMHKICIFSILLSLKIMESEWQMILWKAMQVSILTWYPRRHLFLSNCSTDTEIPCEHFIVHRKFCRV